MLPKLIISAKVLGGAGTMASKDFEDYNEASKVYDSRQSGCI